MGTRQVRFCLIVVVLACLLQTTLVFAGGEPKTLRLRSGTVTGPQDLSSITPELRMQDEDLAAGGPVLLRFEGPVSDTLRGQAAALGIRLSVPLGGASFIAWLPAGGLAQVAGLDHLAWSMPYHPGLRIAPEISAITRDDPRTTIPVTIQLFAAAELTTVIRRAEALGLAVVGSSPGRPPEGRLGERPGRLAILPTPRQLVALREQIARWPETIWISKKPAYRLLNDDSAWVGQSGMDADQTTPIHDHGILGEGQVVGVLDTGIDADMCYFRDGVLGLPPTHIGSSGTGTPDPNQRKVRIVDFLWDQDDPADAGDWDSQDHGTHVAGSVAGDDLATIGERDHGDGMAPRAKLVIQDGGYQVDDCADLPALGCPVVDLVPIFQQAYDQGARMHTNSWGDRENFTPQNIYSEGSEDADEVMWTHPDFLLLFAAGNSGPGADTVGSPASAKNVVAVGATAHGSSAGTIASFSSRGNTEDGRIKPDVTIPGSSVISANNDGNVETENCSTQGMSGTSMASPTAAGLTALVREYFDKGFYPEGVATPADAFTPSAALLKATLIASAAPMENVSSPPPSKEQGWGRILLDDALYFPGDPTRLQVEDAAEAFNASGEESDTIWIEVTDSAAPFKVVLVWTDYPSSPAAATNLVNDLDLVLEDPEGIIYRGNNFVGGFTEADGQADRVNNVEVIKIEAPALGLWAATISAHEIQQPAQGYALVTTGSLGEATSPEAGRASFRDAIYGCDQELQLRVLDGNAGLEQVEVQLWSESETTPETVLLDEVEPGTGRYTGSFHTSPAAAVSGDGLLSIADGDTLTVEYEDADDGVGGAFVAYDVATADCRGPIIRGLHVEEITDQRLSVHFETDEPGTSVVEWGPNPDLLNSVSQPALLTSHATLLNQLESCHSYYLRVRSSDRFGNSTVADDSGAPHTLHTWLIPGLYWQESFEGEVSGWTLLGEWEVGTPQGLGNASGSWHPDPQGAFNNQRALGNDLLGQGIYPGDYEPGASESAQSPPQDASSWSNTQLTITKQLNIDGADNATVAILTNGTTPLYSNEGSSVRDAEYERLSFDVSSTVDGRSSVGVVFGLAADDQIQAAGWTIDDVIFKDGTLPDYDACGGCALAPSFAGASSAKDNDACGADGVTLSFEQATSWGSGGGGSYAIYRDSSPDFLPSAQTLLASGVTELSYNDLTAPTDQWLYYLVRAENDEGCSSGPQNNGLVDDNLVYAAVEETTSAALPALIDTLSLLRAGKVHLRINWQAVASASEYRIFRSDAPLPDGFEQQGSVTDPTYLDLGAAADGETWFYLVRAVNACGNEGP